MGWGHAHNLAITGLLAVMYPLLLALMTLTDISSGHDCPLTVLRETNVSMLITKYYLQLPEQNLANFQLSWGMGMNYNNYCMNRQETAFMYIID